MPIAKKAASPLSQFQLLADELGALEKEMAPFMPKLSRIEAIKKALRAACPVKPDQPWTVTGSRFIAALGPCATERVVDIPKLVKAIGAAVFAKFGRCTLKDLEANVPGEIAVEVVTAKATGSRTLRTFEKET